jgi:DNA-binding transcriptional LysR family regulator
MDEYGSAEVAALVPLLAAFDAAASEGHITRAAHLLGIPQPSLSRRLKTVEKVLGVQLFQPVGRRVALTAAGHELFERTREVMRLLDDAVGRVRSNGDPESGLVRFGFPLSLGPVTIPALLTDFHAVAPRIRLHITQAHGDALTASVRSGQLDLAVIIPAPSDLSATVLGRQPLHLYVAPDHRLATRRAVALSDLRGERFIANPPSYHLRGLLESWCAEAGFVPSVAFEITEFDTVRALVARGLGVAVLPDPERAHPGIVKVGLTGQRERSIGLVAGSHRPTAAVARFRDYLAGHAKAYFAQARRIQETPASRNASDPAGPSGESHLAAAGTSWWYSASHPVP